MVIIVNDTIILELKSVRRLAQVHEVQLVNYLVATGKPIGLLLIRSAIQDVIPAAAKRRAGIQEFC